MVPEAPVSLAGAMLNSGTGGRTTTIFCGELSMTVGISEGGLPSLKIIARREGCK